MEDRVPAVRGILIGVARRRASITYRELGALLGFEPPGVIRDVADLLEASMDEDARAGRPFLAAVVVSRAGDLPRRGFFEKARELGRYGGEPEGDRARAWFEEEYRDAVDYWGSG